jgi:hypothetical protein
MYRKIDQNFSAQFVWAFPLDRFENFAIFCNGILIYKILLNSWMLFSMFTNLNWILKTSYHELRDDIRRSWNNGGDTNDEGEIWEMTRKEWQNDQFNSMNRQ